MFNFENLNPPDKEYIEIVKKIISQEVVPHQFNYKGFDCKVLRSPIIGILCGYVKVDKQSPLYGKHYYDQIRVPTSIANRPITNRDNLPIMSLLMDSLNGNMDDDILSLGSCFDVHGGLTFSGDPEGNGDWWLGFDCGHAGDFIPSAPFIDGVYKEVSYVENQCKKLVDEILKMDKWDEMI